MATHSSVLAWRTPTNRGAWRAAVHGLAELDMTEKLSTAQPKGEVVNGLPGGLVVKDPPASAGDIRDLGSIPG